MHKDVMHSPNKQSYLAKAGWIARLCGYCITAVLLPAHIAVLLYFWSDYTRVVDRLSCQCSCWDTVFKGPYETGIASYKHLYFNATSNSLKIWMITLTSIITLYECVRHLTNLALNRRLRFSMLLLFSTSVFSHYYAWWNYLNYLNDEFYSQWYHQMFFTVTEIVSTVLVIHLADSKNAVTTRKALGIAAIAVLHVVGGGFDQFVQNVVLGRGAAHQVVRDLGFMLPDILHFLLPLVELRRVKRLNCADVELMKDVFYLGVIDVMAFMFLSLL